MGRGGRGGKFDLLRVLTIPCHTQSLAATNRVTEQLNWLAVESFFMSCSIRWMASLIDNLLSSGFDSFGNELTTCEL